jgi:hypothetical protein
VKKKIEKMVCSMRCVKLRQAELAFIIAGGIL